MKLDNLTLDPNNARKHGKRNLEAIKASLQRFGQQTPIVVDRYNVVRKGNGTVMAARELGWETLSVVQTELTGVDAAAYAIADNRTSDLGEFDDAALAEQLKVLDADLREAAGYTEAEMQRLIFNEELQDPPAPPAPGETITKPGDLWVLGRHRLLCGDSTNADDLARLMNHQKAQMVYTDPPYGVGYDGGTLVREKLAGDEDTALYGPACEASAKYSDKKAALYLWHAGVKGIAAAAAAAAAAAGYEVRCELVWNKNQAQFGALSAQYKQKHEPCYYCFKRGQSPRWYGPTNEVTVWDCDRAQVNEYHPTQKPVDLAARAMRNSSLEGDIVADWFGGSGATLIAAEQLNRVCCAMEIDPGYCDVTIARWEALTGQKAKRVK